MAEKPKSKCGRKRIFDDPRRRKILLDALRDGCSDQDAVGLVGCDYTVLYLEKKRNPEFAAQVYKAQMEGKRDCIKIVKEKKPEFLLERKYWEEYGRRNPDQLSLGQVLALVSPFFAECLQEVSEEKRAMLGEKLVLLIEKLQLEAIRK